MWSNKAYSILFIGSNIYKELTVKLSILLKKKIPYINNETKHITKKQFLVTTKLVKHCVSSTFVTLRKRRL
jgi:hypothetical protein